MEDNINRRTFLKLSLTTGAVLTVGGIIYLSYKYRIIAPSPLPFFDNRNINGIISNLNLTAVDDLKEIDNITTDPPGDNPQHDVYALFPLQLPQGVEIDYEKKLGDTILLKQDSKAYVEEHDITNEILFKNVPQNTIIIAPADGQLIFYKLPKLPEGEVDSLTVLYKRDSSSPMYQFRISSISNASFKPLIKAVPFEDDKPNVDQTTLYVPVERGQPVMTTLQEGDLFILGTIWPSGNTNQANMYPADVNLITLPDPSTGQEKLVTFGS